MRQQRNERNIPGNVAREVQTDINLIHQPVTFALDQYQGLVLTSPEVQQLIRAETDSQLLSFFRDEASFFRQLGHVDNLAEDELRKRLVWIESQIEGLEKRDATINGKKYYHILGDLQAELDRQIVINNNYEPRLLEANRKIAQLERQVNQLTKQRVYFENLKVQNDALKEAFVKISDVVRNPQRMREIERTVTDVLNPLIEEYSVKFEAMQKSVASIGRASTDARSRLRAHLNTFLRNIQRIAKGTQEITLNGLEGHIAAFLKDLQILQTFDDYKRTKLYKHQIQELTMKLNSAADIYKFNIQKQIRQNPSLRGLIDLTFFDRVITRNTEVHNYNGVIILEDVRWGRREIPEYSESVIQTNRFLQVIVSQLKTILNKFPQIKSVLREEVVDIISQTMFDDAISLHQIERIFEVIKYKTEVVRVDNVYTYNNQAQLRVILHLKAMIKVLLDELGKVKLKTGVVLQIDEGLLGMIKSELLDLVNPDDIIGLFRTLPKILQVDRIVERDLTRYQGMLTEAHEIQVQHAIYADRIIEKPVTLKQEVAVVIQKAVPIQVNRQKPVSFQQQVLVDIPVVKEVLVDRLITTQHAVQVEVMSEVPIVQTEIVYVDRQLLKQVQVEVPFQIVEQVPVVTTNYEKEVQIVDRFQERLVEVVRQVTKIKQVKVVQQVPIEQIKYIEVQRIVNNFINVPQIVEVKKQIPITVTNTVDRPVDIIQTMEKIVQLVITEQKLVEVNVQKTIPIIQEVPTPYKEIQQIFVKGDLQEVIVEVERIVEKPIIKEILQVKEVHIQKPVPLWVREEKPVLIELKVPLIQNQVQIVTCEKERIVPFREQVQLQVIREIPVPIVCEKEIIRPVRVVVEKIVERMVEVPRVVQVERIVQKIVIVPRIIEQIVQVPQIVEKIVEREVEVLKIVELSIQVPTYLLKQVQQIVPEIVEKPIQIITYQPVDVEKPIYLNTQTEVIREINVKEEIAVEVIHEKQVPVIREKIVDRLLTVRDIEIKERQVVIPFKHQVPIEVVQQKAVEIQRIIERVVEVPQIIQRDKILYEVRTQLQIVEVVVEKPIEIIEKVVYTDVNNYIEYQPQIVNLTQEVVVVQTEKIDVIKPEPYIVERIVVTNTIHQEAVPVYLERIVPCKREVPVVVEVPVPVPVIKEVPRDLIKERAVEVRTFVENNREIPVQVQKIVKIDSIRPQIVEMTQQILKVIVEHHQQEVVQQVAVIEEKNNYIEVPSKPIVVQEYREIYRDISEPLLLEKVVERVTILPQIVEVLKHIHEINDTNITGFGLGVAELGIDVQVHTADYISLCTDLRVKLQSMLVSLRNSRLPEARDNTVAIEQLIVMLKSLSAFPNIVQVPTYIDKIIQKPVVVPTKDTETINRQIAATTLIQKLVEQLKRIERTGVRLELESDLKSIFFLQMRNIERMDDKLKQFSNVVFNRFRALGNWTDQHSLMLNNFLQERFLMAGIVKESNDKIAVLKKELEISEGDRTKLNEALTKLSIINVGLKNSLEELIESLNGMSRGFGSDNNISVIISRAQQTISQLQNNPLKESRFRYAAQDTERLAKELRSLEKELESYRGGESNRNSMLSTQYNVLKRDMDNLLVENQKLKQLSQERRSDLDFRDSISFTREIDNLNRSILNQREQFDRTLKRISDDHERQIANFNRDPRIITSTITDRSPEEEKLKGIQRNLQENITNLSRNLTNEVNAHTQTKLNVTRLQTENNDLKRRLEDSLTKSLQVNSSVAGSGIEEKRWKAEEQRLRSSYDQLNNQLNQNILELNKSRREFESAQLEISHLSGQLQTTKEDRERYKRLHESKTSADRDPQRFHQFGQEQDKMRSPENRPSDRKGYNTPAAQLRMTSPEVGEIQEESYSETSSSQIRGLSQSQTYRPTKSITLRQLINERIDDSKAAKIIFLLCERIQQQVSEGRRYLYSPDNILLENYNPEAIDETRISLGSPIDPRIASPARKYLPLQVLRGEEATEKSCVYNVAIIWDELIHGQTFYEDERAVFQVADFKVRNNKINPIYKNALFEMLKKDSLKRIDFKDVKQRLSLQNYLKYEQRPN